MKGPKAIFLQRSKHVKTAFHTDLMVELRVAIDPKLIIGIRWLIYVDFCGPPKKDFSAHDHAAIESADLHIWKRL